MGTDATKRARIHISDKRTGETRICDDPSDWSDHSLYWWTEGNGGCDCNRVRAFLNNWIDPPEVECNADNYIIVKIEAPGGTVYDDLKELNRLHHLGLRYLA